MINELPTVFDAVTGKKPVKDKPVVNNSGTKAKSAAKVLNVDNLLSSHSIVSLYSFLLYRED
jgi:hypothetical protein